jgi:hypothetical protein
VLVGWAVGSDNYTTGSLYEVTTDVTFISVWVDGIEVYNAAELSNIRDNLTKTYKMMRNIDLKSAEWIPIGDADNADNLFIGKLYGNGYRIDNLTIDNSTGSTAGLFGAVGGSVGIYDLSINLAADGISLTTADTDKTAGALAGLIKYENDSEIIIKNVRTAGGEIKAADTCNPYSLDKYLYVGGLVGAAVASPSFTGSAQITLDNLSNNVPVSVATSTDCHTYLGGIIGRIDLTAAEVSLTSAVNYRDIKLTRMPALPGSAIIARKNLPPQRGIA